jgi:uncharacterized protein YdgA (DUF945 family)
MKKIIIVVAVIAVIAVAAVPFVNGLIAERVVRQAIDDVNETYQAYGMEMGAEIVRYDRGYTSSEIEWKINLGTFGESFGIDDIIFVDRASHQFNGITTQTSLEKNKWYTDFVSTYLDGVEPLTITTTYPLAGDASTHIDINPFTAKIINEEIGLNEQIQVKGGNIEVFADKGFENFTTTIAWDGLSVPERIMINDFTAESELRRVTSLIWDGTTTFNFGEMSITAPESPPFALQNYSGTVAMVFDEAAQALDGSYELTVERVGSGEEDIIENGSIVMAIKNLDAQGYEAYMRAYLSMVEGILANLDFTEDDPAVIEEAVQAQMASAGFQMMAAAEKLLKKDLEFSITKLEATMPAGQLSGSMTLRLKDDITIMQLAPVAAQPSIALDYIYLKSDLRIPVSLVPDPTMLVMPLHPIMQSGFFVEEGDDLVHAAETRDGALMLNDMEVLL